MVAVLSSREGQERQTRGFIERHTGGYIRQDGFLARNLARVQPAAGTCGASAGVFALLGADLCLTLERVLALLADLQRSPEEVVPFDVLQALGLSLPALQRMLSLVEAERRARMELREAKLDVGPVRPRRERERREDVGQLAVLSGLRE